MSKRNFLLGKGERLTEDVRINSGPVIKTPPYTFDEAKQRLQPMVDKIVAEINNLPADACPDNIAIATITMNPEYIAKSYFPSDLLRSVGLETVGSRARKMKPEKRSKDREPEEAVTTELFVMGERPSFKRWAEAFPTLAEEMPGAFQITTIEEISFPAAAEKVKGNNEATEQTVYEVVLHVDEENSEGRYLNKFKSYLQKEKLNPVFERRFYAGGLCFLEMAASSDQAEYIAQFTLVRVVRKMPSLRLLRPAIRTGGIDKTLPIALPDFKPLDPTIKVAIFDGGIPDTHPICQWATPYDTQNIGASEPELLEHGVGVTSAFLFGHIDPTKPIQQPYSYVDHYRVLDNLPGQNPYELYEVLERIMNVLKTSNYAFINLSLGPSLPIDDDDVHAWTAVLDQHLSNGLTLATIAVGNDGEGDPSINANRVQVPADCVNALGIGACDVPDNNWVRAEYSSVGPGRSPGIVKPDLVDFAGSIQRPFLTLDYQDGSKLFPTGGTSFAAPSVMRMGVGIRAHFGNSLNALAIRTLLVHSAEASEIPKVEIGWGRIARLLDDIAVCEDHVMRVVYQGKITASKFIRVPIPLPSGELQGTVTIKATLCYATEVDPHHPGNYTRSGLVPIFRPNKDKKRVVEGKGLSIHANSKSFFTKEQKSFQTEDELRRDAWKWENCVHAENRFKGRSLKEPTFDIHYNARSEGHNDLRTREMQYALVITVKAPKITDLYDQVVRKYATQLEQLLPVIDIPIRV
jgi:hypothetical protein